MDPAITRLEELARDDGVAAPLATLTAESLKNAVGDSWQPEVSGFDPSGLPSGRPLLAGVTIAQDPQPVRRLLDILSVLTRSGATGRAAGIGTISAPLVLLEAVINGDGDRISGLAAKAGTDAGVLSTYGQLVALPLLRACGEMASPLLDGAAWGRGYCPVCAAWPTLAEVRGNERERWLRCGRCGTGWRFAHLTCVFCGNGSHETQGYLAPEGSMESRRAATCDSCHGYLKNVATLLPMTPSEVLLNDLTTLELDGAAMERGYSRPATPGYALGVRVAPLAVSRASQALR